VLHQRSHVDAVGQRLGHRAAAQIVLADRRQRFDVLRRNDVGRLQLRRAPVLAISGNMRATVRQQHAELAQLELPQGLGIRLRMPPHAAQRVGVLEGENAAAPERGEIAWRHRDLRLASPGGRQRRSLFGTIQT